MVGSELMDARLDGGADLETRARVVYGAGRPPALTAERTLRPEREWFAGRETARLDGGANLEAGAGVVAGQGDRPP